MATHKPPLRSGLLVAGWRLLRLLPPMAAWRLLHSTPQALLDLAASTAGRPPEPPWPWRPSILGRRIPHPIGVAAGLDKDGRLARLAAAMGAGFHVVGSVMPEPNPGVEPKVLARLPDGGTINRLGLPSPGVERVVARLRGRRVGVPVAVSIASHTPEGYGRVHRAVAGVAGWVEVNVSCPNVEGGSFEEPEAAREACRQLDPRGPPGLLKIPPTCDEKRLEDYMDVARECRLGGIVAGNTRRVRYKGVTAGLGGPQLYETTLHIVSRLREMAPRGFTVVASGGVDTGRKAAELLLAGADAVEVLSAIIHRGPLAPWIIAWEALEHLEGRRPP